MLEIRSMPSVGDDLLRGLGYGLTSLSIILAAYFLNARPASGDSFVPLALWLFASTTYFSIVYAICFGRAYVFGNTGAVRMLGEQDRLALISFGVACFFLALFGFGAYLVTHRAYPPPSLWAPALLYASASVSYSSYLLSLINKRPMLPVRHQLYWPVMLTIAVCLYLSLSIDAAEASPFPTLLPVVATTAIFVVSEFLYPRKWFLVAASSAMLLVFAALALSARMHVDQPALSPYGSNLLIFVFSVAVAAYLASLESWRITAHVATAEGEWLTPDTALKRELATSRYYASTLFSLACAAILVPFFYVFTAFGVVFLLLFAVHASVAFWWWASVRTLGDLAIETWTRHKLVFGFTILIVVVMDARLNWMGTDQFPSFLSLDGLALLLLPSAYSFVQLLRKVRSERLAGRSRSETIAALAISPMNVVRFASTTAAAMFLIILYMTDRGPGLPSPYATKATHAALVYLAVVLVVGLVEVVAYVEPPRRRLLKTAVAWMVVVRFGTGICLAAAIVIPLLMHGSSPADAATAALPFVLAAMGGFALNDYYDVEKDRISKPYRPLVSRSLDRDIVGLVGVALICVSATLALHSYASLTALTLQLSAAIGVLVYNYVVRYAGLLKGVVAAITSCLPLVYVVLETASPLAEVHLFFWAAFLFLTGREVLMDTLDVAGDSAGGVNTLAVLFGTKPSEIVGWGLVGLGVAMLATFHVPLTTAFYLTVVLVALLSASWLWVGDERVRTRRWVVRALWLPMLIAVLLLG